MLRAMLAIISAACIVGVVVVSASFYLLRAKEQQRLYGGISELMSAMEGTASVAAFAMDATLAKQVATGLFSNPAVARVVIRNEQGAALTSLARKSNAKSNTQPQSQSTFARTGAPLRRDLVSPFDANLKIGVLEVYPEDRQVREAAAASATMIAFVLGLELIGVACAVGWVVFSKVTRPIGTVAKDLHQLKLETGGLIQPPQGNERDEIGQLVGDVNLLVARMQSLLLGERELREQMERSERKYRLIFENVEAGIFLLNAEGRLQSWNPALERMLGSRAFQDAGNAPALATLLGCSSERIRTLLDQACNEEHAVSMDIEHPCGEAATEYFHVALTQITGGMLQGVCTDITERKRAEARARALAERDALTGLLNRRGFEMRAADVLAQARPKHGVALLMVDLDGFKNVNDTLGHDAGDEVLRHVAQLLERSTRRNDILARMGGDEFVLMLAGLSSAEPAKALAKKIIDALHSPVAVGQDHTAQIGASIGIAVSFDADESIEALLRRSDQIMYAVKRAGKNNYRLAEA